jgi:hypothetical protein
MGRDDEQGTEGIFGRGMPGTGGDARVRARDDELDVEGHKHRKSDGSEDDEPERDTEGHLYTGGPRTQGEFTRRGPGENPHGDR